MEKPFQINLNGGEPFEVNRFNSAVVKYIGALALHNHVQMETPKGTGYIFPEVEGYDDVVEYMEANNYPMAINCPEVPEYVIEAHARTIENISESSDIDEEVENWRRLFERESDK